MRSNSFNSALCTRSSLIPVVSILHLLKVAQSRIFEFSGHLRTTHPCESSCSSKSVGLLDLTITSFPKCLNTASRIIMHYLLSAPFLFFSFLKLTINASPMAVPTLEIRCGYCNQLEEPSMSLWWEKKVISV